MSSLIPSFVNFFILVGILAYSLRKPLAEFVKNRHSTLRDELAQVRQELQTAQEKYEEFSNKLKALNSEVAVLTEQTQQDTVAMAQRIASDSKRVSAQVIADAKNIADTLVADLRKDLYIELSSKVLARAEEILRDRLTHDDQARIQKEFSQQVEGIQ